MVRLRDPPVGPAARREDTDLAPISHGQPGNEMACVGDRRVQCDWIPSKRCGCPQCVGGKAQGGGCRGDQNVGRAFCLPLRRRRNLLPRPLWKQTRSLVRRKRRFRLIRARPPTRRIPHGARIWHGTLCSPHDLERNHAAFRGRRARVLSYGLCVYTVQCPFLPLELEASFFGHD